MKNSLLALCFSLLSLTASAQDVPIVLGSSSGVSGTLCDPWQCTPAPVDVAPGTDALLQIRAGRDQFPLLMLSGPTAQCVPVPGVAGSLIVQTDAFFTLISPLWTRVIISGPGPNCGGWIGSQLLPAPTTLPAGSSFLLQVMAQVGPMGQLTFSNAVQISIR